MVILTEEEYQSAYRASDIVPSLLRDLFQPRFWAAAPKGPMTYAFTQGKFLLLRTSTPLEAHILVLRLKSKPWGPNSSLKAQIQA